MSVQAKLNSWTLLEYASIQDSLADERELADVVGDLDIEYLIVKALRHRLLPKLADFLLRSALMSNVPREWSRVLIHALYENKVKCATATREANRIVRGVRAHGVSIVCTKGIVLQSSIYQGHGGRTFNDIDFMIHPDGQRRVIAAMLELGYLADHTYDYQTGRVIQLPRRDLLMYRMYPDHLPHFILPITGQTVPIFAADMSFSLTWHGAAWQISMDDVLAEIRQVPVIADDVVVELPALDLTFDFLFIITHLFRECWFERLFAKTRLSQFADVWRYWTSLDAAQRARVGAVISKTGIGPPVAWVCHYVDQLFGSTIVPDLGLDAYCDDGWLRSAAAIDSRYLRWSGDMRARLRGDAPLSFETIPAPQYGADARADQR